MSGGCDDTWAIYEIKEITRTEPPGIFQNCIVPIKKEFYHCESRNRLTRYYFLSFHLRRRRLQRVYIVSTVRPIERIIFFIRRRLKRGRIFCRLFLLSRLII